MARRTRPFLLLGLALVSGGIAASLALRYLREKATPVVLPPVRHAQIVVAARPLPVGAIVGEKDVRTVDWSGGAVPPSFLTSPADVVGRGVVVSLAQDEPILTSKLAAKGAGGGLPVIIDEGMRAVSVGVDQVVGVSGFVLPNYRVDVLLTIADGNTKEQATRVIMQNVKTLAAGQTIQQDAEGKPMTVPVVTVLVTPEQAETLALASSQGRIQLALRNTLDTMVVRTTGTRVSALLGGTVARSGASRAGAARRAAASRPEGAVVEIYRGGARTLQKF
jgi:pilus assembly protein CpaB